MKIMVIDNVYCAFRIDVQLELNLAQLFIYNEYLEHITCFAFIFKLYSHLKIFFYLNEWGGGHYIYIYIYIIAAVLYGIEFPKVVVFHSV